MAEKIRRDKKQQSPAKPDKAASGKTTQKREKTAVAYQNKDITSKFLAENFKGKIFNIYGLNLPRVVRVLPTNIPTVEQNQTLSDEELMQFIILPLSYRKKEEKQQKIHDAVTLAAAIQDRKQQLFALTGILVFTDKIIDRETADRIRRTIEMTQVAQIFEEEKRQAIAQMQQLFEEEKRQAEKEHRQSLAQIKEQNRQSLAQIEEQHRQSLAQIEEQNRQSLAQIEEQNQQSLAQVKEQNRQSLAQIKEQNRQSLAQIEEQKRQAEEKNRQIVINMLKKNYPTQEILSLVSGYSPDDIELLRKEFL